LDDRVFSGFDRTQTCDGQIDRQTNNRHVDAGPMAIAYTALACRRNVESV